MNKFFLSVLFSFIILLSNSISLAADVSSDLVKYNGLVQHIFFHSLIIYPEKAEADVKNAQGFKDNMITVKQFKEILQELYDDNFILIDSRTLYSFDENGNIKQNDLYLPKDKKPLIISLDDLNYYHYMRNGGFANKLVLDNGVIKTQVITPEGEKIITDDGDVVPILDKFVAEHPDFSLNGAKGIIAVTGFQGILGYRTQAKSINSVTERVAVLPVVDALKKTGWAFANHSYTHNQVFLHNTITMAELADDITKWKAEVEPLVGPTNIFIGPFGQIFKEGQKRRQQLYDAGFKVLYGVGMDGYFQFSKDHFAMNRINIDGFRLAHNPKTLFRIFGILVK